eukprot:TRINITY_DN2892_c0_g1_i7.p1 TRINITY_DN2892_c0_g1~~TRINITY_DN2892_c0_g1_i7.p1  ORF type:complete len:2419 (-),score=418.82 TRINITY_DN2892_c0_g1_i7:68-7138(-)
MFGNPLVTGTVLSISSSSSGQNSTYIVSYKPFSYYDGVDTFSVLFIDPEGAQSSPGVISITLVAVNNPPTSSDITLSVLASSSVIFSISGYDVDTSFGNPLQTLFLNLLTVEAIGTAKLLNGTAVSSNTVLSGMSPVFFNFTAPSSNDTITWTFAYVDSLGLSSPTYTVTINVVYVPPNNTAPTASNLTTSTLEDTSLTFTLDPLIYDKEDSSSLLQVFLYSLPSPGQLFVGSAPASIDRLLDRNVNGNVSLTYVPPPNWFGVVNFEFYVKDTKGLVSGNGTVTITVTSVNDPPTIVLSPSSLVVGRTKNGTFTITISDIDSATVSVVLRNHTFPLSYSAGYLSSLVLTSGTDQAVSFSAGSTVFSKTVSLDWNPFYNIAEGSTANFYVSATDSDGGVSSATPQGFVSVSPNIPPTVVSGTYSLTVDEDTWNTISFSLVGTDLDIYHRNVLSIWISSVTPGLSLSVGGTTINSFPFQLPNSVASGNNTVGTVDVTNVANWNGIFSFTFFVKDINSPTQASSGPQTVYLTVNPVNDPPVTQNVTLTISEQYCQLLCPIAYAGSINTDPFATITASDIDSTLLTLQFIGIPSCNEGIVGYSGTTYTLSGLLDRLSLSKTFLNTAPWNFWFQPQYNKRSGCPLGVCDIFASVPFFVTDGQANSSVAYLNIIVTPNSAELYSRSTTCLEDTDCSIQLISSLPSSSSLLQFVNISSPSSLQTTNTFGSPQNNVAITFPQSYNTTGLLVRGKLNVNGEFILYYQIVDGCFSSALAKQTITILPVNDPPTCSNISITVEETFYEAFAFSSSFASDVDNDYSSLSIVWKSATTSSAGNLQYNPSGTFVTAPTNTPISVSNSYQFYGIAKGDYALQFNSFDGSLLSLDSCYLNIHILPKDLPPVIAVSSSSVVTLPDNTGSTTVNISDPVQGDFTNFYLQIITIDWSMIDVLRVSSTVDPRNYNTTSTVTPSNTSAPFLPGIILQSGGTISFDINWKPNKYHTSATPTHIIEIWALDSRSQKSNTIQISFTTPANDPPVFLGTNVTTNFTEVTTTTLYSIPVIGTDTIFQKDRLLLTIVSLPSLGSLLDKSGNLLTAGQTLALAQSSTVPSHDSVFVLSYQPYLYYSGSDSFNASFVDPEGAVSPVGTIPINLQFVNQPPYSQNYAGSLLSYSNISFTLTGYDIDLTYQFSSQFLSLEILNVGSLEGTLRRDNDNASITSNTTISDGDWNFIYISPFGSPVDTFNFRFFDNLGAYSPIYTATLTVIYRPPPNVPPTVVNATYYGSEDTALSFSINNVFDDTDGNNTKVQVYVTTAPAFGSLSYGYPPVQVASHIPISRDSNSLVSLSYLGPLNWFGSVTFQVTAVDEQGATSAVATITLVIAPVNDPPLISLSPNVLPPVGRTLSGTFTVTISDIDSQNVSVVLKSTTILLTQSTLSFNGTVATSTPDSALIVMISDGTDTFQASSSITWTPGYLYPENLGGLMILYALDSDGGSSSTVTGYVSTLPNNPPTVVTDGVVYSQTVYEDEFDFVDFTLVGTDLDVYHRTVLNVIIASASFDLPTRLTNGAIVTQENLPLYLNTTSTATTTEASISLGHVQNWNGLFTLSFYVTDINTPIPAASAAQTVSLTVIPVNDPPTSRDVSVSMDQNVCFLSCAWGTVQLADTVPSITVPYVDVDSTVVYIDITKLPSKGLLGYKLNPTDLILTQISEVPFTLPKTQAWQFWLQPRIDEHSTGCNISHPINCDPYDTVLFEVRDDYNNSNDTYRMDFIVIPKNIPPSSLSSTIYMNEDTTLTYSLDSLVWDRDSSNSELRLHVTGYSLRTVGNLTDLNGVALPKSGDFILLNKTIVYTPPIYTYSNPDPLTEITFYVEDSYGAVSKISTLSIVVRPVAHPITYNGDKSTTILEDSFALVLIGRRGIDWTCVDVGDALVTVTSLSSRGTWQLCTGSTCVTQTQVPFVLDLTTNFRFYPLPNENGPNYANLTFSLQIQNSYNTNVYYFQYVINVTPVNDPPVLVPLWHDDDELKIDEDTNLKFAFRMTDIDSPLSSLTAKLVSGTISQASLHYCRNASVPCSVFPSLTDSTPPFTSNGSAYFTFEFDPIANYNGKATYTFVGYDDLLSQSNPRNVPIYVRPINDPPSFSVVVSSPANYATLPINQRPYKFTFSELFDVDFYDKPMEMTITSSYGDFGVESSNHISECTFTSQKVVCNTKKLKLQTRLKSIMYYPSWGNAPNDPQPKTSNVTNSRSLVFFLTDLGNTDYRPNILLNHTTSLNLTVVITPSDSAAITEKGSSSSNTVSVAVGIGLGIALVIAILAFVFLRKTNSDVDKYLAEFISSSNMSGAHTSPFYTPATNVVHSKLYEAKPTNS